MQINTLFQHFASSRIFVIFYLHSRYVSSNFFIVNTYKYCILNSLLLMKTSVSTLKCFILNQKSFHEIRPI